MNSKRQTATVECPKSMVGRVIGKNGETIKALQSYSGALIQIDQTVEPTKVTISGTPHSLSLAVSMVTDIVKGTFKGFALLRQVTSPAQSGVARPQLPSVYTNPLAQPRPVYAPGYGLIPPSQLYGGDDRTTAVQPRQQLQPGFSWNAGQVTPSQVILGLQPVGPRPVNQPGTAALLHAQQMQQMQQLQQVYGTIPVSGAPYGGLTYYPQDFTQGAFQQADALLYQDPTALYSSGPSASSSAKIIQAAAGKGGARSWVPKVPSNNAVNELLGTSSQSPMNAATAANNLMQVMDQEGKVYYYNPVDG